MVKIKSTLTKFIGFFMFALSFACFCSCGSGEDVTDDSNSENEKVAGTKWTMKNWDYGVGDDWVSTLDETYTLYFYSSTEGLIYYGRKDNDSDFGSSIDRVVAHFEYEVSGNEISLEYITDKMFSGFTLLMLKGNSISSDGFEFEKGVISSSDKEWLATLHGITGNCKWYHNLKNTVWIEGEGDMGDYSSYSKTPWAARTTNYVVVNDGIKSIGAYAFASSSIGDVKLPSSITKIRNSAFSGTCITYVSLNKNIREIGNNAFSGCKYLDYIFLPDNIEVIGDFAFNGCKKASLANTKNLKRIGSFAFDGCKVDRFTDSEVLEEVGECAFTNLTVSKLVLPKSLKTLKHLAFSGGFSEIRVESGLNNVTGTPFYPSKTGRIYVNISNPIKINHNFLDPASGWTLYVPKGSKSLYSKATYWKQFKSIIEDASLEGGGDVSGGDDEETGGGEVVIPTTYSQNVKSYKWVKVEHPYLPDYYMMQTELCPNEKLVINGNIVIDALDKNSDNVVIKAEFRNFLDKIKELTGMQLRLATKEEWQYAAAGGNLSRGYVYSGGDDIDEVAWYRGNSGNSAHEGAMKKPNELGLYDMCGNHGDLTNDNIDDIPHVDGFICGGNYSDNASACKISSFKSSPTSGRVESNTQLKELNAFDAKKIAVRLVFNMP